MGALTYSHSTNSFNFRTAGVSNRMIIDSSGNVGIGTISPAEKLTIDGTVSGAYVRISNAGSGDVSSGYMIYNGSNLDFNVYTNPTFGNTTLLTREALAIRAGGSERMRITATGDVCIANTAVTGFNEKLNVTGYGIITENTDGGNRGMFGFFGGTPLLIGTGDNVDVVFRTDNAEKMRITSGGNVGISTINPTNGKLEVQQTATTAALWVQTGGTTDSYIIADFRTGTNASVLQLKADGSIFMLGLSGSATTGSDVRYSTASGELYYQTSSKRYKTDIINLESSLDKINSLRPVRYKDINTGEPACGLIAEETVKVIPEVVFNKEIEGFDKPQIEGINYTDIIPFLIKSIQELKAEIETLKLQING